MIETHNATTYDTLMMGMEAIGDLMTVAGGNEHQSLQPFTVAQIGDLFRYLTMQAQRAQEAE